MECGRDSVRAADPLAARSLFDAGTGGAARADLSGVYRIARVEPLDFDPKATSVSEDRAENIVYRGIVRDPAESTWWLPRFQNNSGRPKGLADRVMAT